MLKYLSIITLFAGVAAQAQDCSDPALLCAETANSVVLDQNAPVDYLCLEAEYTTYFQFETNTNSGNTGNVIVSINGIQCQSNALNDTIQMVIVQVPDGGDPCVPASYVTVSDCVADTLDFFVVSEDLQANSQYMVIIGSDHDPFLNDCAFDVVIEGPAVDIDACCDAQIPLGQSETFTVTGGEAIPGYSWAPAITLDEATGDEVTATPEQTTTYTVSGNVGECQVTDQVTLTIGPPISVPNTITPNGDGINDVWRISGISDFPQAQVTVFSRWGQVVFRDIGYAEPWDGTNRGKRLPTATYYYVIELNSFEVEIPPVSGSITLVH